MSDNCFYRDGIRFECTGCANCCKTRDDNAYVYLSDTDVGRISTQLQMARIDFLNAHCHTDENGFVHLKMLPGRCVFLNVEGKCRVYNSRPMQCRTWPFWHENMDADVWENEVRRDCPGIGQGRLYSREEIEQMVDERRKWYGLDF